jgi:hypothetical protein
MASECAAREYELHSARRVEQLGWIVPPMANAAIAMEITTSIRVNPELRDLVKVA